MVIFTVTFCFFTIFYHFWDKTEVDLPVSRIAQNVTSRYVFVHLRNEVLYEYYQEKVDNLLHKVEN